MASGQPEEADSASPPKGGGKWRPMTGPQLKDYSLYYYHNLGALRTEILAGFSMSVLKVPEAVAFSYIAGVHPLQGLYGSFFMGVVTALFGGRPGMISGCAGAIVVVIREMMEDSGPFGSECQDKRREYVFFTMILAGIMQLLCGLFHCATLMKLIPQTVVLGFFNGLAILLFTTRLETFTKPEIVHVKAGCDAVDYGIKGNPEWFKLDERTTWLMIVHILIAFAIMEVIPRLPAIKLSKYNPNVGDVIPAHVCPPSFLALAMALILEWCLFRQVDWDTPIVRDLAHVEGRWPLWHIPDVPWGEWETWWKCLPYGATLCAVGLIETLLTVKTVDLTLGQRTCLPKQIQECLSQALGNALTGFFSAVGGDGMMGESRLNVSNGAQGRLSAFVDSFFLIIYILVFHDVIESLPTAAVTGVIFYIALHMFQWHSLNIIARRALPHYMCATIIIVTIVSVLANLGIGILVGVLWECVWYVWNGGSQLEVRSMKTAAGTDDIKTYTVVGKVFFANADQFNRHFTPNSDPPQVIADFANAHITDYSALVALDTLGRRYQLAHKGLSIHMRKDDYERYKVICDEPAEEPQKRSIQKWLPTCTTTAIEGNVAQLELRPYRYQAFVSGIDMNQTVDTAHSSAMSESQSECNTLPTLTTLWNTPSNGNATNPRNWDPPDAPEDGKKSDPDTSAKDEPVMALTAKESEDTPMVPKVLKTPYSPPPTAEAVEPHPLGVPIIKESSVKFSPEVQSSEVLDRKPIDLPRNATNESLYTETSIKTPSEVGSEESV